ncbi:MAG: SPOR domain-containing protein [Bacteroidota bacterium]
MKLSHYLSFLVFALVLSACSGAGGTVVEEPGNRAPTFEDVLRELPASETFDEASYPTEAPIVDVEVVHDVPEALLTGSVGQNLSGSQQGWRIQVVFAREKAVADQAVDNVHGWLSRMRGVYPDTTVFQQPLPVYNVYVQPYFRVRVGDFTSREYAEELLAKMIADYPKAFVVVDRINVRR